MKKFIHHNSLSIVFLLLFVVTIIGQTVCGFKEYNKELSELGAVQISMAHYFASGHFIEAVFENWESEFFTDGNVCMVYNFPSAERFLRIKGL